MFKAKVNDDRVKLSVNDILILADVFMAPDTSLGYKPPVSPDLIGDVIIQIAQALEKLPRFHVEDVA
jgi:hypothetical protein